MFANQLKTALLLGMLSAVLLLIGYYVGGISGLTIAIVISVIINFSSLFWSDRLVLSMYKAKEIKESENKELHDLVKELAMQMKIPKPRIYLIPSETPNAFATGRSPSKAAVAVTNGILKIMNRNELKGVLAHELSHIKNRDTLIATIAATIAGVISYVAMMARFAAIFGGGKDQRDGNGLELLVLAILAPLMALIIQLAISRSREYLADESAARSLSNGQGLANALRKLEVDNRRKPLQFGNSSTASLFIVNPFSGRSLIGLFSTHPPIQERVKRLESYTF